MGSGFEHKLRVEIGETGGGIGVQLSLSTDRIRATFGIASGTGKVWKSSRIMGENLATSGEEWV